MKASVDDRRFQLMSDCRQDSRQLLGAVLSSLRCVITLSKHWPAGIIKLGGDSQYFLKLCITVSASTVFLLSRLRFLYFCPCSFHQFLSGLDSIGKPRTKMIQVMFVTKTLVFVMKPNQVLFVPKTNQSATVRHHY